MLFQFMKNLYSNAVNFSLFRSAPKEARSGKLDFTLFMCVISDCNEDP